MRGGFTRTEHSVPIYLLGWENDSFLGFTIENVSEDKMTTVLILLTRPELQNTSIGESMGNWIVIIEQNFGF